MKLETQVCTLEQASKLAALGVKQSSLFYWAINSHNQDSKKITMHPDSRDIVYSAFTVAELGVMIPEWHFIYPRLDGFASYKNEGGFFAVADGTINGKNYSTEAECRAALIIYLIENNTLSVKTCNERLLA